MTSGIRKTFLIILLIVAGLAGVALLNIGNDQNNLPRPPIPSLEPGVIYTVTMTSEDAPYFSDRGAVTGVQQDYLVNLKAGNSYWFESSVGWLGMEASLSEDGLLLGEMECGYNARCNFSVKPTKDTVALLRVKGDADSWKRAFTLDISVNDDDIFSRKPSSRTGKLYPASIPVVSSNVIYTGAFRTSDSPVFRNGEGSLQDYRIHLSAGQRVLVNVKSKGFDVGISLMNNKLNSLEREFSDDGYNACIDANVAEEGMYLIRLTTGDTRALKNGDFTLEVSTPASSEQTCTISQ